MAKEEDTLGSLFGKAKRWAKQEVKIRRQIAYPKIDIESVSKLMKGVNNPLSAACPYSNVAIADGKKSIRVGRRYALRS